MKFRGAEISTAWAQDLQEEGLRFQSFRVSEFQSFRVSEFQSFRVSEFQSFRVSEFQSFRVSEFGVWDSRFPGSRQQRANVGHHPLMGGVGVVGAGDVAEKLAARNGAERIRPVSC